MWSPGSRSFLSLAIQIQVKNPTYCSNSLLSQQVLKKSSFHRIAKKTKQLNQQAGWLLFLKSLPGPFWYDWQNTQRQTESIAPVLIDSSSSVARTNARADVAWLHKPSNAETKCHYFPSLMIVHATPGLIASFKLQWLKDSFFIRKKVQNNGQILKFTEKFNK